MLPVKPLPVSIGAVMPIAVSDAESEYSGNGSPTTSTELNSSTPVTTSSLLYWVATAKIAAIAIAAAILPISQTDLLDDSFLLFIFISSPFQGL